jgi:hypothetical protein
MGNFTVAAASAKGDFLPLAVPQARTWFYEFLVFLWDSFISLAVSMELSVFVASIACALGVAFLISAFKLALGLVFYLSVLVILKIYGMISGIISRLAHFPPVVAVTRFLKAWWSGGQCFRRTFHIEMRTVCFVDEEMLARWRKLELLAPRLRRHANVSVRGNGRRLTNLGAFRAYCRVYLKAHPKIHKGMAVVVRQLAPGEFGVPLEFCAYVNGTARKVYEDVQSDITAHLLSVVPLFHLAVYQRPGSADGRAFSSPEVPGMPGQGGAGGAGEGGAGDGHAPPGAGFPGRL